MRQVFGGAVLVIAGIAAFIEASSHHPVAAFGADVRCESGEACHSAHGLSETAYDLIRRGSSRAATSTRSSPISEGLRLGCRPCVGSRPSGASSRRMIE